MSKKVIDVQENVWVEDQARIMAKESLKILSALSTGKGEGVTNKITLRFTSCFIEELLKSLFDEKLPKEYSQRQRYERISSNFSRLKMDLQNHIAAAFQVVVSRAVAAPMEYYCEIKTEVIKSKVSH